MSKRKAKPDPKPPKADDVLAAVKARYPAGSTVSLAQAAEAAGVSTEEAKAIRDWAWESDRKDWESGREDWESGRRTRGSDRQTREADRRTRESDLWPYTDGFFDLASPGDMLRKAERELVKLDNDPANVDHVFNFFVTAFHVKDYILAQRPELKDTVKNLLKNEDMKMCDFICNKGKHMKLTQRPEERPDRDAEVRFIPSGFGTGGIGTGGFGGDIQFFVDGKDVKVCELAKTVVEKWREFFEAHGIA